MTVLLDLDGRVQHTDLRPVLDAVIRHAPLVPEASTLEASLSVLPVPLLPGPGGRQVVLLRVVIDDLPGGSLVLETGDLAEGWSVEETQGEGQTWSFALPASSGDWQVGPLLTEHRWMAPPPGLCPVAIELVYLLDDGSEAAYRLVTDGLSAESERAITAGTDGEPVHLLQLTGLGPEGRYDRKRVTLELLPFHGKTHGELIRLLALEAGIPEERIAVGPELGYPLTKAVEIVDEEWTTPAGEIAEALRVELVFDRVGVLVARPLVPPLGTPPAVVLTEAHLLAAAGLSVQQQHEAPTCITITGRRVERPADAVGRVRTVETVEVWDEHAVPGAWWQQDTLGVLQPLGGPGPVKWQILKRTKTIREYQDGCLVLEEVIEEAWSAPQVARYTQALDGSIESYKVGWLYHEDAVADGNAKAYAWPRHRFLEISRKRTVPQWDERGRRIGDDHFEAGWRFLDVALQERTEPTTPWEDVTLFRQVAMTGDRRGVSLDTELYFAGPLDPSASMVPVVVDLGTLRAGHWAQVDRPRYTVTEDNYVTYEPTGPRLGWGRPEGWRFRYSSGEDSSWHDEAAHLLEEERTTYTAEGNEEASHSETVQTIEADRSLGQEERRTGIEGYLPAAELCDEVTEALENVIDLEAIVCAPEGFRVPFDAAPFDSDWIETEEHAEAYGIDVLVEAWASTVQLELPVCAALHKGMPVALDMPRFDLVGEGWIRSATQGQETENPMVSRVVIKRREL